MDDEKWDDQKQPLSLNQRHHRILSDFSASFSKPTQKFAGVENDENSSDWKLEFHGRRRRLCKAFEDNDVPDFSGIVDFDSPSPPFPSIEEQTQIQNSSKFNVGSADHPTSSGITNFNSPSPCSGEEVKPETLRIEGRRLCKSSKNDDDYDTVKSEVPKSQEAKYLEILDFHSPSEAKIAAENDCGDGKNEIWDILSDLNSKFEVLSIEKNRVPKRIDLMEKSGDLVESDAILVKKKEVLEYESAASSFSISSDLSTISAKESSVGCAYRIDFDKKCDLEDVSETGTSHGQVNESTETFEGLKRNDVKLIAGKSVSSRTSFCSTSLRKENIEEDDDCILVSGKNFGRKAERRHGKSKHISKGADNKYRFLMEDPACDFALDEEHAIVLAGPRFTFSLPGKIGKMLFPHQRDGLKWLWSLHSKGKGGILGDDMGLGKTMQICGFLAGLFHSNLIKRAMVVAPKTLLPHWIKELSTVDLSPMIREYFGTNANTRQYELQYVLQDKGILLTTYDIVRHNAEALSGDYCDSNEDEITWDYLILDEGHLIKNPSTQRAKSLILIPATHRIIISGTPLQNNLKELWALFNFCCPELLGDYKWFKDKYEKLINRANEKNASDREKRIGSTVAKDLREKIQPYFLRRLKSEVFGQYDANNSEQLSKKSEIIVWLKLTSCQRQIYEAFLKSEIVLSAFDGSPLAALTILKKICDHPLLLTKRAAEDVLEGMDSMLNQEDHGVAEKLAMHIADVAEMFDFAETHDISCKTSFILSLLGDLIPKKHHVLIFSQTRKMLNLIQESIISSGYKFMRIDGTTKACDRLQIVNDFQEGRGASIFLLTSQVGGLGLTLTKADRVIVVDPAWNPSTDNQSVDRAYRIGQKKDVIVYRLMTCGTVEEKIYRMQIFKGGLFRTATEHKEQMRYFSKQDLQELFSLPKQGFDISLTQQQLLEDHGQEQMMDDALKRDIEFLESLDIAGVSQHSLLFSKTAPEPAAPDEDEDIARGRSNTFTANTSSYASYEQVDGAQYAFNPKDVKVQNKNSSPSARELTETEIRENINRLSQMLANKATISRLPDNGEKIRRRITELNLELRVLMEKKAKDEELIRLEDLSGEVERALNMK